MRPRPVRWQQEKEANAGPAAQVCATAVTVIGSLGPTDEGLFVLPGALQSQSARGRGNPVLGLCLLRARRWTRLDELVSG